MAAHQSAVLWAGRPVAAGAEVVYTAAVRSLEDGGRWGQRAKLIWLKANASTEGFRWQEGFPEVCKGGRR